MALTDIVRAPATRKGPPCTVCECLATLPEAESAHLLGLLSDTTWRYTLLADELAKQGVDLSSTSLSRHARGGCHARTRLR